MTRFTNTLVSALVVILAGVLYRSDNVEITAAVGGVVAIAAIITVIVVVSRWMEDDAATKLRTFALERLPKNRDGTPLPLSSAWATFLYELQRSKTNGVTLTNRDLCNLRKPMMDHFNKNRKPEEAHALAHADVSKIIASVVVEINAGKMSAFIDKEESGRYEVYYVTQDYFSETLPSPAVQPHNGSSMHFTGGIGRPFRDGDITGQGEKLPAWALKVVMNGKNEVTAYTTLDPNALGGRLPPTTRVGDMFANADTVANGGKGSAWFLGSADTSWRRRWCCWCCRREDENPGAGKRAFEVLEGWLHFMFIEELVE